MQKSVKLATLFRRSLGAPDALEVDMFWSALGDTTKAVSEIHAIFNRYPLPSTLREQLLEGTSLPNKDLLKSWIKAHPEGFRAMKAIKENTIQNKAKRSLSLKRLLRVGWSWMS